MKKKYIKTYKYIDGNIYDSKNCIVDNKEYIKIINKYKPPDHLNNIEIIANTVNEADNGIIYIGIDSKNKKQYIYGINFIKKRRSERIKIFLKVYNKLPEIEKYIQKNLLIFKNIKQSDIKITDNMLFAVILLIEMCFFIRTGKKKYLDDNETIGLITLQKYNFKICNDIIHIHFKGKLGQQQSFVITKIDHLILYNMINILYNNTDDYIFKNSLGKIFTESKLYSMMKIFEINLKDIRTFGVNRILIKELWKHIRTLDIIDIRHKDIKKIISEVVKTTAYIIGHTPTISKNSYIVDEIRFLIDINTINNAKNMNFLKFYLFIVEKLKHMVSNFKK